MAVASFVPRPTAWPAPARPEAPGAAAAGPCAFARIRCSRRCRISATARPVTSVTARALNCDPTLPGLQAAPASGLRRSLLIKGLQAAMPGCAAASSRSRAANRCGRVGREFHNVALRGLFSRISQAFVPLIQGGVTVERAQHNWLNHCPRHDCRGSTIRKVMVPALGASQSCGFFVTPSRQALHREWSLTFSCVLQRWCSPHRRSRTGTRRSIP